MKKKTMPRFNKIISNIKSYPVNGLNIIDKKSILELEEDYYRIVFQGELEKGSFIKVEISNENDSIKKYFEDKLEIKIFIQLGTITILYKKMFLTKNKYKLYEINNLGEIKEFEGFFKDFKETISLFELV